VERLSNGAVRQFLARTDLSLREVVVAIASGPIHLAGRFAGASAKIVGDRDFFVFSEAPPPVGQWIPLRFERPMLEEIARIQAQVGDREIRFVCVLLTPDDLYRELRWMGIRLGRLNTVFFNENLDHFMLRPGSVRHLPAHAAWRLRDWFRQQTYPGGRFYTWAWRFQDLKRWRRPLLYRRALQNGRALANARPKCIAVPTFTDPPEGITVVIPSRQGVELLERALPPILAQRPHQVVVVDNGSSDGTAELLARRFPSVETVVHQSPLSFAAAVNRGIERARHSHVCLLNNDMEIEEGFFAALRRAFDVRAGLFCATAQILFPESRRREETGKAVMPPGLGPTDFPIRCPEPVEGENYTEVLYGSGGCSMYRTGLLRALGGFDETFVPAYVEDLDMGYRGWLAGGSTVFVSDARVLHRHRATTGRFFTPEDIASAVEKNYFRFLNSAVTSPEVFSRLWAASVVRNNLTGARHEPPSCVAALEFAAECGAGSRTIPAVRSDERILALGSGEFARFPGRPRSKDAMVAVASCYAPFPLSHGGAVRMYNLMRRAAADYDQILIYFADELRTPPPELLDLAVEVVVVRRRGSHVYPSRDLPDVVQDFRSAAFGAVLAEAVCQWKPSIVQLEFTQLAQYAPDCGGAKTILVEHDVTIDLYRQLHDGAAGAARWEYRYQLDRWERFERQAWRDVDRVVVMSERDRSSVGPQAVVIPNGVDTDRFRPASEEPESGRLLFIGSFAHLPNVMALEFLLTHVWPQLNGTAKLHVIAGSKPEYYLEFYRSRVQVNLDLPGLELEAFVSDVRPAYRRAQVVVAPLLASAGTNIKILEAMAMGKAIVSTPAGIHGLDLTPGKDVIVTECAEEMSRAISHLIKHPEECREVGANARATVEQRFSWDSIAHLQRDLYDALRAETA
jgi:GT2 family glycosyltransferase/glycosyltransferase involved in cell wall biosynthesis